MPFRMSRLTFTHYNYLLVLLAVPAFLHGVRLYGIYAIRTVALSVAACMAADVLFESLFGRKTRVYDGSAALCGVLLALLLPPTVPWWSVVVGCVSAVFLGRQLFGGAGGSPFNAVCIGWAVITVSWPQQLDPSLASIGFSLPFEHAEYPLSVLDRTGTAALEMFPVKELLLGHQAGCIGTGAPLLLLAGGIAGILFGVIPWVIPVSFVVAVTVTALLFIPAGSAHPLVVPVFHLLTGYTVIGGFFIAPDTSSRPVTPWIMAVYGAAAGILTVLFRAWSSLPEGLPFAILIVNMAVPLLDRGVKGKNVPIEMVRL